ncbi:MAG TPA: histidine kinase dimerization/phospho-acceptor domain-containing protein, partial [Polyangiaceae bacterium]|nr:histidine kinase dimerization/phospho-acceptor domain-containing protein [Polyangiaceae bacterium]
MRRRVLALVPLAVALFIEWAAPEIVGAYHWFLFYPAAFLSSWIGGRWMGLLGTLLTTALVWWLFIPPEHALLKPLHELAPAAVFCTMGLFFAVFHDRLRAANATLKRLVDERRVFVALIENSSDFIGIADASGKPIYVNPAGRRMVGMAPDFPVGETQIPEYYPPEQRQFVRDVIIKTMIERGHWQGETYFRNWQTQEPIPVSDEHFIIREPETGRVLGAGTVTRDITDLKRARDEIEAVNEKLKELDELKTRFFANVSHELRTPLALILGPVRTLLESPATSSDARRDLEVIERNALTLLRHVNDLLDVAKLEAGAMKLDYAETDVARMVRFVAGHFEAISSEKSVAWTTEAPASLNAQLDPEKLQRILFNLMSNACKFTPGGGRIRVTLRDEGADRLAIEVADSGPGIPADKRELVFERFSQLDEGATRR